MNSITVFCWCVLIASKNFSNGNVKRRKMPDAPIKLYYLPPAPPCRAVLMTAQMLGLPMKLILIDIFKGEHMTREHLKMNPTQTLPIMDDSGFILWESQAIMTYLVSSYGKDDSLYPKNLKLRAIVDQMLYFDWGALYPRYLDHYVPLLLSRGKYKGDGFRPVAEALEWLDTMVKGSDFIAGDKITVADISIMAYKFDMTPYGNVMSWYKRTKKKLMPYGFKEVDQTGADILALAFKYNGTKS